jgi:hypothetical protein
MGMRRKAESFMNQVELGMQCPVDVVPMWIMMNVAGAVTGVE